MRYLTAGRMFSHIADARAYAYRIHKGKFNSWKEDVYEVRDRPVRLGYVHYDERTRGLYWHSSEGTSRVTKKGRVWY